MEFFQGYVVESINRLVIPTSRIYAVPAVSGRVEVEDAISREKDEIDIAVSSGKGFYR